MGTPEIKPFHYFTSNQLYHVLACARDFTAVVTANTFSTGQSDKPVSLASRTEKEKSCPNHVYKLNFIPFNLHYSFGFTSVTEKYISPLMPSILTIQKCL